MNQSAYITGANGFIGSHLVRDLQRTGWQVATLRARPNDQPHAASNANRYDAAMAGKVVFHLGGIAHRRAGLRELMAANRDLTVQLYEQAARTGAVGFVFLSTSKVLGDGSVEPLDIDAPPRPTGPYAESKAAAEAALAAAHRRFHLPLALVRPPLVYGPGVKAKFRALLKAIQLGLPLPLATATARRSYVSVANLTSALATIGASFERLADNRTWHVADGDDIATAALCRALGEHLGRGARLFPVPQSAFEGTVRLSGGVLSKSIASLFEPCPLDPQALRASLGWSPPQALDAALKETALWFAKARH